MFKHGMSRRAVAAGVAAASMGAALVAGALPGTAGATGDHSNCGELEGYEFGFKIEATGEYPEAGTYSVGDNDTEVTLGDVESFSVLIAYPEGPASPFTFDADTPVGAVIVKAATDDVTEYDPQVTSGELTSPKPDSISHIEFCWNEEEGPEVTTTLPGDTTTVPGEVTTTVPGEVPTTVRGEDEEMPPATAPPAVPVPAEPSFTG